MNVVGTLIDWVERIADGLDHLVERPAGAAEPHYHVSEKVTASRERGIYTYHVDDDQLGQGSSLGNRRTWIETKGNGDLLGLFAVEAGKVVVGGLSLSYMMPFSDISPAGSSSTREQDQRQNVMVRAMPTAPGRIHLHPAYQQHELVIGDGLHVLETIWVPNTGDGDPAAVNVAVRLENRTRHPVEISVVGSLNFRGHSPRDMEGDFDPATGALLAWNRSDPSLVRVFGCETDADHHWITTDEEEAYSPGHDLPDRIEGFGEITGALQRTVRLLPRMSRLLRFTVAASPRGRDAALAEFRNAVETDLDETVEHYAGIIGRSVLELPDLLLSQAMQWAKTCLYRVIAEYPIGICFTNDPGDSTHLVGRDVAWYVHGADFILPDLCCPMLRIFGDRLRDDGLVMEYIDGADGAGVHHGMNINDNTPLFVMAVAHHLKATGHDDCARQLLEPARRATELILSQRNDDGLVACTGDGLGVQAICGWRNVLQNEQITGVVTEINSECYAALLSMAEIEEIAGEPSEAVRFRREAAVLKERINDCLINRRNGLYHRNIDLNGCYMTEATVDLVFPLIFGVAPEEQVQAIMTRLSEADFMTEGGIRALPSENPRYDPAQESGCLGGVWPGATWWFAMGCTKANPSLVAHSLRRSYWHYVADPKTYNTVPGQFSEWSDGQTLVNRGMRLSPWEAPRFIWAAVEGLAGLSSDVDAVRVAPSLPADWKWLRLHNLQYRGTTISFFLIRSEERNIFITSSDALFDGEVERYDEEIPHGVEAVVPGLSAAAFGRGEDVMICLGNSFDTVIFGPFLAHRSLEAGSSYRVRRLQNLDDEWQDLGEITGERLQLLTVRLQPLGYALYRFEQI